MRARDRALTGVAAVAAIMLLGSEFLHWQASRRGFDRSGPRRPSGGGEVVVVLGYSDPGPRAHLINRYRVRAGLRSVRTDLGRSRLVLTGGPVAGPTPESELMAAYARELGYQGELITEVESRTTRENVVNVIELISAADRIKIVSNSLHAEQARGDLWRLRPDLARRLAPADDYRFGELILIKPLMVGLAVRRRIKLWRRARRRARNLRPRTPGPV